MQTNSDQIRELVEKWTESIRNKNIDGILANHSENIVMFDLPFPLQSKGIEEYKKTWELFFSWTKESRIYNITELEIIAGDTVAFCHGIGHCAGENPDGTKESLEFRLTIGLQKIDGQWIVTHEHHSIPSK